MDLFRDKVLRITGGTGSFGNAVLNRLPANEHRRDSYFQP
jgi:FlaA1/EpsC-like NDP-sugar epimerase